MRARIRLAVGCGALACIGWFGAAAHAQSDAPPAASESPPPASEQDAGRTEEPKPTPPPATPKPTPTPLDPNQPLITPWPWPFPWMEPPAEATPAPTPGVGAGAAAAGAAAAEEGGTRGPTVGVPQDADALTNHGIAPDPVVAATIEQAQAPETPDLGSATQDAQGMPPAAGAEPGTTGAITSGSSNGPACEYKAIPNELSGDGAAILQMAVQNEDCTWSGSQVLLSYDIRGPPVIDVLAQSTGITVDVEVFVSKKEVLLGFGHAKSDGTFVPYGTIVAGPAPVVQSTQQGDNVIREAQEAFASSGDAVSGSQRVGVHVDGDAQAINILAQNASPDAFAMTGPADANNAVDTNAGTVADSDDGPAQAGQVGDNDVAVDQDAVASTGDAIAGSQEIVVRVSGSVGELGILAQNASPNATAVTGDATATNGAGVNAGLQASTGNGPAQAGQIGDNRVDVDQFASAHSGNALAGAQSIDVAIGGNVGSLAILAANDSTGAFAQSGKAVAANDAAVNAGPSAYTADGTATTAHIGDNDVAVSQFAEAISGTAAAGSQLIKVQVGGSIGQAAVQPVNASNGANAVSGTTDAKNALSGSVGGSAQSDDGVALVQQKGTNDVAADQEFLSHSGDGVAGGQVVGVVEHVGVVRY